MVCRLEPEGLAEEAFKANIFYGKSGVSRDVSGSQDGRGRYLDNIFIERLWRSIKYELIYLMAFDDGLHLNREVNRWFDWYNQHRPHQALDYRTPNQVYQNSLTTESASAHA